MQEDQGRVQSALLHQSSHTPPEFTPPPPGRLAAKSKELSCFVYFCFIASQSRTQRCSRKLSGRVWKKRFEKMK